ncbi:MAG: GGDEF domain-containing protein [Phycisphaerales bacterium]|nr:GGDEF domain-containing protein [Phycisphaerales bacterium]
MTRPSFRNTSRGGGAKGERDGASIFGSPFSQAQITHLMKTEFSRARRHGIPLSVAVFQVDRLRPLVDLHGSELRDTLRTQIGRLIVESTRSSDFLGSLADDRFVVLMPHTEEASARRVADRLIERFGNLEITVRGQALALGLSAGVASNADTETLFFDTMLSQAEIGLEWAANDGGNVARTFSRERFGREGGVLPASGGEGE